MDNTGSFTSALIYFSDESMKQWSASGDEAKHVYPLFYDKNDRGIGHFPAINKIQALLAVEGVDKTLITRISTRKIMRHIPGKCVRALETKKSAK